MTRIEARAHLRRLVGRTIRTATRRLPNRVVEATLHDVVVATYKSPAGQAVPLSDVPDAFDHLAGDRTAFVGAATLSLPHADLLRGPTRVALRIGARS